MRLTPRAYELGLCDRRRFDLMEEKRLWRDRFIKFARSYSVKVAAVNDMLAEAGSSPLTQSVRLVDLISRPQLTVAKLESVLPDVADFIAGIPADRRTEIVEAAEILIKYSGYIEREKTIAEKLRRLEDVRIPASFDFASLKSLSTEARQKLERIRPETIGRASRIPGISPSDVNILLLMLNR